MPNQNNLSTAVKKAMTAPETDAVLLTLLTISCDGNTVLRAVDDKRNIVSRGETFHAIAFKALLPDQGTDGNKTCRLQIDNADISIYHAIKEAIRNARSNNTDITATASVILSTEPDDYVIGPLSFILRNLTASVQSITGELYDLYLSDKSVCTLTYSPDDFPGLFF